MSKNKISIGDLVKSSIGNFYVILDKGLRGVRLGPPPNGLPTNKFFHGEWYSSQLLTAYNAPRSQRKPLHKEMFFVSSKDGATHKRLVHHVNNRKIDHLGNSVQQAMSKYEDKFGKKIDPKEAIVWKLVPHTVRIDKKNNRFRIGSEIK